MVLCLLLVLGLIYYFRKYNNKKILNSMYNIVYSCNDAYVIKSNDKVIRDKK